MTKESCEKIISKYYNKDWKNSYIYMLWKNMKNGQVFQLPGMDIIREEQSYNIYIVWNGVKNETI